MMEKKYTILLLIVFVSSFAFWYTIGLLLSGPSNRALQYFLLPMIFGGFSLGLIAICAIIFPKKLSFFLPLFLIPSIAIIRMNAFIALYFAVSYVLFSCGVKKIRKDATQYISFNLRKNIYRGVSVMVAGVFIMISVFWYYQNVSKNTELVVKIPDILEAPIEKIIETLVPRYRTGMTVNEFLEIQILSQTDDGSINRSISTYLENNPEIAPGFQESEVGKLFSKDLDQKDVALTKERKNIRENFGVDVQGDERFIDLINRILNEKAKQSIQGYRKLFPAAYALMLFFLLHSLRILFVYQVFFFAGVIFKFLKAIHMLRIEKVEVFRERVVL